MLALHDQPSRLCDGLTRRELLRVGGLSLLGLSLPRVLEARQDVPLGVLPTDKTFGCAKSVIFLYLCGGPPQHETFDPKPEAPVKIRGPFKPISTNVPGIHFCELLPRTARIADKLAVVRSIATDDNTHSSSGYWVMTGYKYVGLNPRTIQASDRPNFGSVVKKLRPSDVLPPLSTVWIPDMVRQNENVTPAGQTGGIMGRQWDPDRFLGDPNLPGYEVEGLRLGELPPLQLQQRIALLDQVNRHFDQSERGGKIRIYNKFQQQAIELLTTDKARRAFEINQESKKIREQYGRHKWGQCLLLARRLVEAGVRLVHVNWPRAPGDNAVDNPLWDTHAQNADRLEDSLCPRFDVGFTTLIDDLDQRGLLDETLVVAIGEFGRTPKINAKGGRDHWGHVFSFVMAGAGIAGGQVFGASDKTGGHPIRDRIAPADLTATIFHQLGIQHQRTIVDRGNRAHPITTGQPIRGLLGLQPATRRRVAPGGNIARVPPYDESPLLNTLFEQAVDLRPADGPSRPKGWRAAPLFDSARPHDLCVKFIVDAATSTSGKRHAGIGYGLDGNATGLKIAEGTTAILAQEVRSPFAGTYVLTAQVRAEAVSPSYWEKIFLKNFSVRLIFYEYSAEPKTPLRRKQLASVAIEPPSPSTKAPTWKTVELSKSFLNPQAGANFSFGLGLGVAIVVEKTSSGVLDLSAKTGPHRALLVVDNVQLTFVGKQRDDNVKV